MQCYILKNHISKMVLDLSPNTTLKNIIFSKNIIKKRYWSIWFKRNINKIKDPFYNL